MHSFVFRTEASPGDWRVEVQGADLEPVGFIRRLHGGYAYWRREDGGGPPLLTGADLESLRRRVRALEEATRKRKRGEVENALFNGRADPAGTETAPGKNSTPDAGRSRKSCNISSGHEL